MPLPQELVQNIQAVAGALASLTSESPRPGSYFTSDAVARMCSMDALFVRRMLEILVSRKLVSKRSMPGVTINGDDASVVYRIAPADARINPAPFPALVAVALEQGESEGVLS